MTVQNRIILIVGFRGSGKSTTASLILQKLPGVFLYDPHGDDAYEWIQNTARSISELEDYKRWYLASVKAGRARLARVRYIPDGRIDPFDSLQEFCAWLWTWRRAWACIEEVSESCRSTAASGMPGELHRLVSQGRHKELSQVYAGIRYAEIARPISAGANAQILFYTQEPGDLDAMAERIGREATDAVAKLRQFECLIFYRNRTWQVVRNNDSRIPELAMREGKA